MLLLGAALIAAAISTGPDVGAKIPGFSLLDQTGKTRDFAALKGPKGLVLVFFRSADW
jgi:peroxiredoxin